MINEKLRPDIIYPGTIFKLSHNDNVYMVLAKEPVPGSQNAYAYTIMTLCKNSHNYKASSLLQATFYPIETKCWIPL